MNHRDKINYLIDSWDLDINIRDLQQIWNLKSHSGISKRGISTRIRKPKPKNPVTLEEAEAFCDFYGIDFDLYRVAQSHVGLDMAITTRKKKTRMEEAAFARAIEIMIDNIDLFPEDRRDLVAQLLRTIKDICEEVTSGVHSVTSSPNLP